MEAAFRLPDGRAQLRGAAVGVGEEIGLGQVRRQSGVRKNGRSETSKDYTKGPAG
jgi:hypothetical protein